MLWLAVNFPFELTSTNAWWSMTFAVNSDVVQWSVRMECAYHSNPRLKSRGKIIEITGRNPNSSISPSPVWKGARTEVLFRSARAFAPYLNSDNERRLVLYPLPFTTHSRSQRRQLMFPLALSRRLRPLGSRDHFEMTMSHSNAENTSSKSLLFENPVKEDTTDGQKSRRFIWFWKKTFRNEKNN